MLRFNRIGLWVIALLALTLSVSAAPTLAAGITVTPKYGDYGTTFAVEASGFNRHERVSLWVGLADGTNVALTQLTADGAGNIEYAFMPQPTWQSGEIIVVAHGQNSHRELVAKVYLQAIETEPTVVTNKGTLLSDPPGLTLYYRGYGYQSGERVAAWFQYPNELDTDTAHALPDVYANGAGEVIFPFTVQKNSPYGGYHITARGTTSQHVTYNTFSYFGTIGDHFSYGANGGDLGSLTWQGEYFNNRYLSGAPAVVRTDASINFNWGWGSPAANINADDFSVRWTTTAKMTNAGDVTIRVVADDGIRVWVDGHLVIDEWQDQVPSAYSATVHLDAGQHNLRVEYYEHTGSAVVQVEVERD